jgi:two-component system chemotaxis sensor kinase CheA
LSDRGNARVCVICQLQAAPENRKAPFGAAADPGFAVSFTAAYDQLIDDFLPRDLCLDQMPRRLTQGARELRCNYVPLTEGDQIQGLLVVIEDITTELEQQRGEADRKEMFALFESLTRDRLGLLGFFDEGNEILRAIPDADNETQKRLLHTLKGNAAMLGFDVLATICHALENDMADSGTGVLTPAQVESLRRRWGALTAALNRFLGDHGRDTVELSARTIDRLARDVQAGASTFQVLQRLAAWKLEPVERPLARLSAFARALAKRLGKGDLEVEVEGQGVRLDPEEWSGLWSQLGHVVRNAVDHGIETPAERRDARKAAGARLRLGASVLGNRLVVRVGDDGAGIDWEAVRTSAERRGLPHATRAELVDALFKSGITTRSSVTRTSGRGVGLASIQSYVEERRGRVTIESRPGEGTTFEFSFPLGEEGYQVTGDTGETGRLRV